MAIGIGISTMWHRGGGVSAPDGNPSNLVLTVVSDTEIDGTFTEGSTNQDGFRVYISTDNVTFTEKTTVTSGSFQATGLTDGTIYYFYVVAYKGSNESSATTTVDACTIPSKFLSATVQCWYDYTDTTLKAVSSGRVSQVNDKSANAYHQTQGAEGKRPYDLGITGIQGQGAQRIGNTTALPSTGDYTCFIVARVETFETGKGFLQSVLSTNINAEVNRIMQSGNNPLYITAPSINEWFLITSVVNESVGGLDILQINKDVAQTATNNGNQNPVNFVLGYANDTGYLKGSLKMLILINEALGSTDITKAQDYINWKYDVFF